MLKPGFHLQQTPRPRHKKPSYYVVEQSSFFPLIAVLTQNSSLSWSKLALGKPGFTDSLSLVPIYSKHHDHDTKNQSDYVLEQSSFPVTTLIVLAQKCHCRGRNWLYGNQA